MMTKPLFIAALSLAAILAVGEASALCSEPIAPYCASDGKLSNGYVSEAECRRDVKAHLKKLGRYRGCLTGLVEETESEIERFKELLSREGQQPTG